MSSILYLIQYYSQYVYYCLIGITLVTEFTKISKGVIFVFHLFHFRSSFLYELAICNCEFRAYTLLFTVTLILFLIRYYSQYVYLSLG